MRDSSLHWAGHMVYRLNSEIMNSKKSNASMGKHARIDSPTPKAQETPAPSISTPTPRGGYQPMSSAYAPAGAEIGGSPFANKKAIIIAAIVAAVLVLIYAGVGVFFSSHFYPGTTIGSVDISMKSGAEVRQIIDDAVSQYTLTVEGDGLEFSITSAEAGASLDSASLVRQLLKENNPALWPAGLARGHDLAESMALTTAGGGLGDLVRSHVEEFNTTAIPSEDATLAFDEATARFVIVPEVYGTAINSDAVVELVGEAVAAMESSVTIGDDELIKPEVLEDDERIVNACKAANVMAGTNVTFTVAGTSAVTLAAADIAPWVVVGEDYSVALDQNAVSVWADAAAGKVNTYGTTRTYTRGDGKTCTVSGGVYGWIADKETLVANVTEYVQQGTVGTFEMPMSQTAASFTGVGSADWGSRYVDVDLSEQYARFYDGGGTIWESSFVSGKPDPEMATPTGVYVLNGKQSPSTLIGSMVPETGEPEYETEVQYWMPFVGNAVGFHDASWQPSFGGTMYADGYGSHGCINLPTDMAASLYSIIAAGDVVIVHN